MEVLSNDSNSSYEIVSNVVEEATANEILETIPFEPTIPPQPIDQLDMIENEQESAEVSSLFEMAVVPEVSFPRTQHDTREKHAK